MQSVRECFFFLYNPFLVNPCVRLAGDVKKTHFSQIVGNVACFRLFVQAPI